ncbi:PD-(D/E)XK nuclease domain-containing protein [Lachnospiraceae bacterium ZAX-1]
MIHLDLNGENFNSIKAEVKSAVGRADAVVETDDTVYAFEFKLGAGTQQTTTDAALLQIDDKGYLIPYTATGKKLVKIGVLFDHEKKTIGEYAVKELFLNSLDI